MHAWKHTSVIHKHGCVLAKAKHYSYTNMVENTAEDTAGGQIGSNSTIERLGKAET